MTDENPENNRARVAHGPKQIIVMRTDLKMRKGKMIAQGAHASMKVLLDAMIPDREKVAEFWGNTTDPANQTLDVEATFRGAAADWILGLFTKVCVRVDSEEALDEVYANAVGAGLPCAMIVDAGKTEFNGVPTKTCCAIGPALPGELHPVTGHLKLL